MTGTRLNDPLLVRDEDDQRNCDEICLHIDSNTSLEVATKRVFIVGHKFILSHLKELAHSFGLKWNVCTFRSSFTIKCNRAYLKSKHLHQGLRSTTSITCGCEWIIRFMGVIESHYNITNYVVISSVSPMYYNTCDPTYSGQLVLCRTRSSDYKHCCDEVIREIMAQMASNPFVNVRAMTNLLQKALPERKDVDRHMINNVRIRARREKLDLDSKSIQIDPKHFDTTFINPLDPRKQKISTGDLLLYDLVPDGYVVYCYVVPFL